MQLRIEKLHRMAGRVSRWLKPRVAATVGLAAIESALILSPPAGLEVGYVPIALFEGLDQPAAGCTVIDAPYWTSFESPPPPPHVPPTSTTCPVPAEVPPVCALNEPAH
eukprot:6426219-Prymnesium_polylepis.1